MIRTEIRTVTPEDATALLDRNVANRPLSRRWVYRLAQRMADGEWRINGETIKIDRAGNLLDGQHRLAAIVSYGGAVDLEFRYDVDRDAFATIDQGKKRGFADLLAIDGYLNVAQTAGIATQLWRYTHGFGMGSHGSTNASTVTLREFLRNDVPDLPNWIIGHYGERNVQRLTTFSNIPGLPPSVIGALWYAAWHASPETADGFFNDVAHGEGLIMGDPAYAVRETLFRSTTTRRKLPNDEVAAQVVRGWNAYVHGRRAYNLKGVIKDGKFPTIEG